MSQFPLYKQLYDAAVTKFVSKKKKREIIQDVAEFDANQQEHLYVIIKMYQMSNDDNYMYELPYNAQCVASENSNNESEKDITFDLESFPPKLKNMLYDFCQLTKNI